MAPPVKRRKLSSSTAEDVYAADDTRAHGIPAFAHAVEPLRQHWLQDSSRIDANVVERVHVQEAKHALGTENAKVLHPRKDISLVTSVPAVPTIPTFGIQTFTDGSTTITYTPPALPSLPTLPLVPGATTVPASTPIAYTSDGTATSLPTSSSAPSSGGNTTTPSSSSHNPSSSATNLKHNSTATISRATIPSTGAPNEIFFFATLQGGEVSTITRSSDDFTTTFRGSTFTVSGYESSPTTSSTTNSDFSSGIQSTATPTTVDAGGQPYGDPAANAPESSSTSPAGTGGGGGGGRGDAPPAGAIAGGVVGGAAGLAVLVFIALLFVRWYRRKGQSRHQALPATSMSSPDVSRDGGPGMAERAGIRPFAAVMPALFRHGNRSESTSERGFTRVSGRKLPSQWSQGMSSPAPPNVPRAGQTPGMEGQPNVSSPSVYRDSRGFDGGEGVASPLGASLSSDGQGPLRTSGGEITMSPGPERQPTFHFGGPYQVQQPGSAASGTFGRSETPVSLDQTRSSRFTEDM